MRNGAVVKLMKILEESRIAKIIIARMRVVKNSFVIMRPRCCPGAVKSDNTPGGYDWARASVQQQMQLKKRKE